MGEQSGLAAEARKHYRGKESVAKRSISDCRRAIQIARGRDMTTLGMTVTLGGEQMLITDLRIVDKQWVSGDRRFTPKEKELLTKQARAIIAEDAPLPAPPE